MTHPFVCERCGGALESDDAVSIIEGACCACRTGIARGEKKRRPEVQDDTPAPVMPMSGGDRGRAALEALLADPTWVGSSAIGIDGSITEPAVIASRMGTGGNHPKAAPGAATSFDADQSRPRRRRDLLVGVGLGLAVVGGLAAYILVIRPNDGGQSDEAVVRRSVTLTVEPPGAAVYLDGEEVVRAGPEGGIELTFRTDDRTVHWIDVAAAGYHGFRQPVSSDSPSDLAITLIRKPYELAMTTEPADAEVWINGELKGFTPLSISLEPTLQGTAVVRRVGYRERRVEIAPPPGGQALSLNLELEVMGPVVRVESDPPGARVVIGGQDRGAAPVEVELEPSAAGTTVPVVGRLSEFEDAVASAAIPVDYAEPVPVRLSLRPSTVSMVIDTEPSGGQVAVDGRMVGQAPVAVRFARKDVGRLVKVEALSPGQRYGAQSLVLPDAMETLRVRVAMADYVGRVVFAVLRPDEAGASWTAAIEALADEIHRLDGRREFALVIGTDDGVDAWPSGLTTARASAEQKVRAYDTLRSLRETDRRDWAAILQVALRFDPDALWVVTAGDAPRAELERIEDELTERQIGVSVVCTGDADAADWGGAWTLARRGTFTVLGTRRSTPALAGEPQADAP